MDVHARATSAPATGGMVRRYMTPLRLAVVVGDASSAGPPPDARGAATLETPATDRTACDGDRAARGLVAESPIWVPWRVL